MLLTGQGGANEEAGTVIRLAYAVAALWFLAGAIGGFNATDYGLFWIAVPIMALVVFVVRFLAEDRAIELALVLMGVTALAGVISLFTQLRFTPPLFAMTAGTFVALSVGGRLMGMSALKQIVAQGGFKLTQPCPNCGTQMASDGACPGCGHELPPSIENKTPAVDANLCDGCGDCVDACPDVFEVDLDGKCEVLIDEVDAADPDDLEAAVEACPKGAIRLHELVLDEFGFRASSVE